MESRLLPERLDNRYRGHPAALWLFGMVVALKATQSLAILFAGRSTASGADGIPLASFEPSIAQTVVSLFAQGSLWRLFFCLVGAIVLVRYRSGVPLMLTLFALNYLAAQLAFWMIPLPRVGTPPGPTVNLVLFGIMILGLVFSLRTRSGSESGEVK